MVTTEINRILISGNVFYLNKSTQSSKNSFYSRLSLGNSYYLGKEQMKFGECLVLK